ncbi:MAG: FtsQ-type POTRA domain-containing protein [Tissierellia bacterium]|nr:FtsQ-type POTRA domain-containing protein [Tissierellia bacterium]
MVLVIILSYLFIFKTDFFILSDIVIIGNKKLKYDSIVKASNCNIGENIFKINTKKGQENLKLVPYVKDCKIKKQLPDKIIIEIEERKEIAAIEYLEHLLYIDNEGYILEIDISKKDITLPIITGLNIVDYKEGSNIFQNNSIGNLKDFIVYGEYLNILSSIDEIDISNKEDINIELNNGTLIAFGPLNNVKYKLSFLNEILKDIDNKNIDAKQILFNKGENPIIVIDNR